jgi:hypothetical protein
MKNLDRTSYVFCFYHTENRSFIVSKNRKTTKGGIISGGTV